MSGQSLCRTHWKQLVNWWRLLSHWVCDGCYSCNGLHSVSLLLQISCFPDVHTAASPSCQHLYPPFTTQAPFVYEGVIITAVAFPRCVCATGHHPVMMGDGARVNSHLHTSSSIQLSTHTHQELSSNKNSLTHTHGLIQRHKYDAWAVMAACLVAKLS